MIRYTLSVSASLIELGVLYDHSLPQRIQDGQIQLVYELILRGKTHLINLGYVTDIFVADGSLKVTVALKPSVSFFFVKISDITISPVLIGCGTDWRLLRFDVIGK